MFSLIHKIKDIKTLALTHLQQLRDESRFSLKNDEEILKNCSSLLNNDVFLLTASTHLVKQLQTQSQDFQKLRTEVLQQIQSLQEQQQQYQDQLLSLVRLEQPKLISTNQDPLYPEVALMAYLYTYLPSRNALDIGAHVGEVSKQLLQAGYEVYAFEPVPSLFHQLQCNLGERASFHSFKVAIGAEDGTIKLTLADLDEIKRGDTNHSSSNLPKPCSTLVNSSYTNTVQVELRSLESLHQSQEIPADVGLVRIDAENLDLEIIRGMGRFKHPLVVAKFGGAQPFLQNGKADESIVLLEQVVQAMKQRDYHWHIVICRNFETREVFFYCNDTKMPEWGSGNVLFFQSYNLFAQALKWCSSVLKPAYFVS